MNTAWTSIPGHTLSVLSRTHASAMPNGIEHEQALDEPVREAERDSDENDRRRPAEEAKERLAEPAEHQLLHERRDDREEDDVRANAPACAGSQWTGVMPCSFPGLSGSGMNETTASHATITTSAADASRSARHQLSGARRARRSKPAVRDQQDDAEPDGVEDRAARERRVLVDDVRRGLRPAAFGVGEPR